MCKYKLLEQKTKTKKQKKKNQPNKPLLAG